MNYIADPDRAGIAHNRLPFSSAGNVLPCHGCFNSNLVLLLCLGRALLAFLWLSILLITRPRRRPGLTLAGLYFLRPLLLAVQGFIHEAVSIFVIGAQHMLNGEVLKLARKSFGLVEDLLQRRAAHLILAFHLLDQQL